MKKQHIAILVLGVLIFVLGIGWYLNRKVETAVEEIQETQQEQTTEPEIEPQDELIISDTILPKFEEYYAQNDDLVGWIKVPNTLIDYPIVQAEDNDFYLHRDFEKNYLFDGIPFMDFRNILKPDLYDNTLIYGHNMGLKGTMFTELMRYKNIDFYKKSPLIQMDTLYHESQWKVIAVYEANTEPQYGEVFEYYNFVLAQNEAEFQAHLDEIYKRSYYTTGVDVQYGDKLITLQTCLNDKYDTKLIVTARRVRPGESLEVDVNAATINENRVLPR